MRFKNIVAFLLAIILAFKLLGEIKDVVCYNSVRKIYEKSKTEYSQQLEEYNKSTKEYAEYIKSLGLSDLEIIIKVINDMWTGMEGYCKPESELYGIERVAIHSEKKGICRHIADDFTAKMNMINPKYKARNIYVYVREEGTTTTECVDINRVILERYDDDITDEKEKKELEKKMKKNGNHQVSAIELDEEDLTLIVDPTNLLIGIMRNGKIIILNSDSVKMDYIEDSTEWFSNLSLFQTGWEYYETYFESDASIKDLKEDYGITAQKEALEAVLKLKPQNKE